MPACRAIAHTDSPNAMALAAAPVQPGKWDTKRVIYREAHKRARHADVSVCKFSHACGGCDTRLAHHVPSPNHTPTIYHSNRIRSWPLAVMRFGARVKTRVNLCPIK